MSEIITTEKPSPIFLERAGFRIPADEFSLQRAVFAALKDYTEKKSTAPGVTFHSGQPPLSTELTIQQFAALELKDELTQLEGIAGKVASWMKETIVPKIVPYSDDVEYKQFIRNMFASSFSQDQTAVVYGDENRAVDLIHQVITKSVGSKVALLKRNYPPKEAKDEILVRTGIESELESQNYIHLIVQDSSQLTEEQRIWVKDSLRKGHCFVTDVVTSKFNPQKSLATDKRIADLVFTVDATTPAQLYGIYAIFGNQKAIGAIQRLHEETIGTLPTTAMEIRLLLEDENIRTQILSITPDQIAAISNSSLAQVVSILKDYATLQFSDNPDQKDQVRSNLNLSTSRVEQVIKQHLRKFYFSELPDDYSKQMILASGGSRGLLSATERYFFEKDEVDTIAVLSPHWPYNDTFKNVKIVALDDCFKENGDIDTEKLKENLVPLGEKVALIMESGGRFPDGNVHSLQTKQAIIKLGAELRIQLWDDAMFHRIVFGDNDNHSFLEVAKDMVGRKIIDEEYLKKIITFWTGSKHLGIAGLHMGAIMSLRDDLIKHLSSGRSPKPDALALHIANKVSAGEAIEMRNDALLKELKARMDVIHSAASEAVIRAKREDKIVYIPVTTPQGAYFSELTIDWEKINKLTKIQMERLVLHLAREYGIGVLPMSFYYPNLQDKDLIKPSFRITGGGNINPDEMKRQVLTLIDTVINLSDDEIAAIKK